ncbi:hypothetical protein NUW54_g5975 [Trametes sanguinea]|uniref:Uncharacterized protein n=1 Tax=Trametes sanguinea TaxID=158606 RepID=A0ACC1PU36_9APHY|nr:hypothetical protein NUW54_g5975 [Trametes sanguinea]
MSSDQLVTVDDSDTQSIRYSSPATIGEIWNPLQPPNDPNVWAGTLMEADAAGLSAVFSFKGSQVFVYGRLQPPQNGSEPPLSLYSVGDNKFQAFPAPSVDNVADNVSFFNSSVMPYGEYTLVINITRASRDSPYYLDYIRYNITDPNAQPSQTSSSSTSSSPAAAASSTSAAAATKGSSSTPIGPIVGGLCQWPLVKALGRFQEPRDHLLQGLPPRGPRISEQASRVGRSQAIAQMGKDVKAPVHTFPSPHFLAVMNTLDVANVQVLFAETE